MMKSMKKFTRIIVLTAALVMFSIPAWAARDYYLYDNQGASDVVSHDLLTIEGTSYFVAMDIIPSGTYAGRILAATGTKIYLQDAVDTDSWTQKGTVGSTSMDPSFIKVSPDGSKVALGRGWGQDLLVFSTSAVTSGSVVDVTTHASTKAFSYNIVNYYDAAWADDDTYLVINGGNWDDSTNTASNVGITWLDITDDGNDPVDIIDSDSYPGASSGIAVDSNHNLIFGNGYTYSGNSSTGELVMLDADDWWDDNNDMPETLATALDYDDAVVFAEQVLSAAHLGYDQEGNLYVGGGQFFTPPDYLPNPDEIGFFALLNADFMSDVASGTFDYLDDDEEDDATRYRKFEPDYCGNDSAIAVISYGRSISGIWIDGGDPTCTGYDTWGPGVEPTITTYRINTSRDGDSDTYADVTDNSPWTAHTNNADTDGDGYGNIIDGDFNDDGIIDDDDEDDFYDYGWGTAYTEYDMDYNGIVDDDDEDLFYDQWVSKPTAPFYNTTF